MKTITLTTILVLGAAAAASARVQAADPGPAGTPVPAGEEVRVRTTANPEAWLTGELVHGDAAGLTLLAQGDSLRFEFDDLRDYQVRVGGGTHAGGGAAVGAIILGTAALGLGTAMASDDFFDVDSGDILAGTLVGAAAGALVGSLIGSFIPSHDWEDAPGWGVEVDSAPDGTQAAALSFRF